MRSNGITLHLRSEFSGPPSAIDAALKTLKTSSRQLQTFLAAFRDEMQTLERLYYKGKNQHRAALFWRRVSEVRRYGERFNRAELAELVEGFRRSFWGPVELQNPKLLKASWTHFPDRLDVEFLWTQLSTFRLLCNKSLERTLAAFEHISLCMQTGAFIQLLLTLYAIFSRAHNLLTQSGNSIDILMATCLDIKNSYGPSTKILIEGPAKISESNPKDERILNPVKEDIIDEPETIQNQVVLVAPDITFKPETKNTKHESTDRKRSKPSDETGKKPKKRKKKNEIDDIFGF